MWWLHGPRVRGLAHLRPYFANRHGDDSLTHQAAAEHAKRNQTDRRGYPFEAIGLIFGGVTDDSCLGAAARAPIITLGMNDFIRDFSGAQRSFGTVQVDDFSELYSGAEGCEVFVVINGANVSAEFH